MSAVFAQVVAMVGRLIILMRHRGVTTGEPAIGGHPNIPEARPQGKLPTLKMPTARGWTAGQKPTASVIITAPTTMTLKLAMATFSPPNRSLMLPPGILMSEPYTMKMPASSPAVERSNPWNRPQ